MQVRDSQLREDQMKQMHHSMLSAVQESRAEKGNQSVSSHELKEEYEEQISRQLKSIKSLSEQLKQKEYGLQNLQL